MRSSITNAFIAAAITTALTLQTSPAFSENTALNDLTLENFQKTADGKAFDQNHWAYKTLKNISEKYGLLIGKTDGKFQGNGVLTRNEAAVILVSLVGKIEEQNKKISETEKAKIEILQEELEKEIDTLSGRVARAESSINALKGRVTTLEDNTEKTWKYNYGKDLKITGGLQTVFYGNFEKGTNGTNSNFSLPYGEVALSGKLHDRIDYMAKIIPTRNFSDRNTNGLLEDIYIGTDIIPYHYLYVGHTAVPFGIEAAMNPMNIDFIEFSQISRNLGQGYDTGLLLQGDHDFISYYAGAYNGSGYNTADNDSKMTVVTQLSLKPFYKTDKLGDLSFGASHLAGNNTSNNLEGIGVHAKYNYKKFCTKSEFMTLEGANSPDIRGKGWYVDAMYQLNKKFTLLSRFDNFDPNVSQGSDTTSEYTMGLNYLFRENLLVMLNYTFADRRAGKESNRLGLLTQLVF